MNTTPVVEEYDDDAPVGRLLNRREMLALLGGLGAAALLAACDNATPSAGATPTSAAPAAATSATANAQPTATTAAQIAQPTATAASAIPTATTATPIAAAEPTATTVTAAAPPSCVVRPAMTEGPYFVDEKINRADIRTDTSSGTASTGTPLTITFLVSQVGSTCAALANAQIDIWHCDAAGVYSDASDRSFNTQGKNFLRGYQVTDANGATSFTTIYPGWYQGRAVHIHFKIRTNAATATTYEFTSQLFFDDSLTDKVHAQQPYAAKGQRDLRNAGDGIYQSGGDQLILPTVDDGNGGYKATFTIGMQI